jgi:hypothetical protein
MKPKDTTKLHEHIQFADAHERFIRFIRKRYLIHKSDWYIAVA